MVDLIYKSRMKELFVVGETKLRISGSAKEKLQKYLEKSLQDAANAVIDMLPKISKGPNKGQLKRITIKEEDIPDV